jgi:hypothetical protein
VGEQLAWSWFAGHAQMFDCIGDVGRVAETIAAITRFKARGSVLPRFVRTLGYAPLPESADRMSECVALFVFVRARVATPPQLRKLEPVKHEERTLNLADFPESKVELVFSFVSSELLQRRRRCNDTGLQRRYQLQDFFPPIGG